MKEIKILARIDFENANRRVGMSQEYYNSIDGYMRTCQKADVLLANEIAMNEPKPRVVKFPVTRESIIRRIENASI